MTFPTIVAELDTADNTTGNAATCQLPTWDEQAGDVILVLTASRDNCVASNPSAGFNLFINTPANDGDLHCFWAESDGSSYSGQTMTYTLSQQSKKAQHVIVLRGAGDMSVDPPSFSTTTGNTGNPNPPSHSVPWTAGEDNFWFYVAGYKGNSQATHTTDPVAPTDTWSNPTTSGGGACSIHGGCWYDTARDTLAPGTMTMTSSNDWNCATVAIRTAAETGTSLTSEAIESATSVDTPTVSQTHDLSSFDVRSSTEVDTPTVSQTHGLSSFDIRSSTEVDTPTLTETAGGVSLTSEAIASTTRVSQPTVSQTHDLSSFDVRSSTEVDTPTVSTTGELISVDVTSATEVDTPTLTQTHALGSSPVESATNVDNPILTPISGLNSLAISSTTRVSEPTLSTLAGLDSAPIEARTETDTPALTQVHSLSSWSIRSATEVSNPGIFRVASFVSLVSDDRERYAKSETRDRYTVSGKRNRYIGV